MEQRDEERRDAPEENVGEIRKSSNPCGRQFVVPKGQGVDAALVECGVGLKTPENSDCVVAGGQIWVKEAEAAHSQCCVSKQISCFTGEDLLQVKSLVKGESSEEVRCQVFAVSANHSRLVWRMLQKKPSANYSSNSNSNRSEAVLAHVEAIGKHVRRPHPHAQFCFCASQRGSGFASSLWVGVPMATTVQVPLRRTEGADDRASYRGRDPRTVVRDGLWRGYQEDSASL